MFFVLRYGGVASIRKWLRKPERKIGWIILLVVVGLIPLPFFLLHNNALAGWTIWLPWVFIWAINPWIEEFYWRGLLLDYTRDWSVWASVLFASAVFAVNHVSFGINSEVNSGFDVVVATFIMGIVWSFVYLKTKSLRWAIFSHVLVDFFNLSAASFTDAFDKGGW